MSVKTQKPRILRSRAFVFAYIGSPNRAIYTPLQPHDSIALTRLSKHGIFEKASVLYEKGASVRAIARELDVPKTTVRQTLVDGGVTLRPHAKRQLRGAAVSARISTRTAPYGWCLVDGKLVVDPKEASVLRLILKLWRQGMNHCAIARRLNEQRIKPRKAAQWSQPTVGFIIKRHEEALNSKEKSKWESKNLSR
jgi:hypothetical protein